MTDREATECEFCGEPMAPDSHKSDEWYCQDASCDGHPTDAMTDLEALTTKWRAQIVELEQHGEMCGGEIAALKACCRDVDALPSMPQGVTGDRPAGDSTPDLLRRDVDPPHAGERPAPALPSIPDTRAWQPIETAPQDGTEFLGACQVSHHVKSPRTLIVFWYEGHQTEDCDMGCEPCWCAAGMVHYVVEPTRWMPLPSPPVADRMTKDDDQPRMDRQP